MFEEQPIGEGSRLKVLLAGLNAKYIHSSLALYSLAAVCRAKGQTVEVVEYTINQEFLHVLGDIADREPDVVGFACYIWNRQMTLKITSELKKILPEVLVVLGGPEVSADAASVLEECPAVDYIIQGEGDESFSELLEQLAGGARTITVAGVAQRMGERIELNGGVRVVKDLDGLPFPYTDEQMHELQNRIVYYESSRGCPFSCSYCVSAKSRDVRTRSVNKVKEELGFFLRHSVSQVKFIDRTFNVKPEHYREIWLFLQEHQGKTGFHFEIVADLLTDEDVQWLANVPPQLFQFEIGIQSTAQSTLEAIGRHNRWGKLARNIGYLREKGNIHLHLDLIVGLPQESFSGFADSFNATYSLQPNMLQIGFLKLLPGTRIRAEAAKHGYVCLSEPPYEILANHVLSYKEVLRLKCLEEVFNQTYNSGRFTHTLSYLVKNAGNGDAFLFYCRLSEWWKNQRLTGVPHSPDRVLGYLLEFAQGLDQEKQKWVAELLKFDVLLDETRALKGESLAWNKEKWEKTKNDLWRSESKMQQYVPDYAFTNWRDIKKRFPIEVFSVPVISWIESGREAKDEKTAVLFDLTHHGRVWHLLPRNDFSLEAAL